MPSERTLQPQERFRRYAEKRKRTQFKALPVRIDRTVPAGKPANAKQCNLDCFFCHEDNFAKRTGRPAVDNEFFVKTVRTLNEVTRLPLKIHIAGNGEPTLTGQELVDMVARLSQLDFIANLSMTTNGLLLEKMAGGLKKAGLASANVSVHSMDPARYKRITRRDALEAVLRGIELANGVGLNVKINCAVTKELGQEIGQYLEFASKLGIIIKLFPIINEFQGETGDLDELLAYLKSKALDSQGYTHPHNGRIFLIGNAIVDFVDDRTMNLCINRTCHARAACNEGCRYNIRLTADGMLQPCPVKFDNMVDLVYPSPHQMGILEALREGGKL